MIPTISFSEILEAAAGVFVVGMTAGGYLVHKIHRKLKGK